MNKSLGEYIRLIPREDQDTMVCALLSKRAGFHRGMLAFVPIEELKRALRPRAYQKTPQNQWPLGQYPISTPGYPSGSYVCTSSATNYTPTQEVPQTYLFAYAALLAAINAMPGALDYHEPAEEDQLKACEA